jgi:hypothetical protein
MRTQLSLLAFVCPGTVMLLFLLGDLRRFGVLAFVDAEGDAALYEGVTAVNARR